MIDLGELEFHTTDASKWHCGEPLLTIDDANRILAENLEKAEKVFAYRNATYGWAVNQHRIECSTHTARLVCIEDLKK